MKHSFIFVLYIAFFFGCHRPCDINNNLQFADGLTVYNATDMSASYGPGENDFFINGHVGNVAIKIRLPYTELHDDGVTTFTLGTEGTGNSHTAWVRFDDNFGQITTSPDDLVTDATHTGTLTITEFGKRKLCISGEFSFDAMRENSTQVIHISGGKFGMNYTLRK